MDKKYSSNRGWKNKYFFTIGQWEFHHTEKAEGLRVPRETGFPFANAFKELILLEVEMSHVSALLGWAQQHKDFMGFSKLFEVVIEAQYLPLAKIGVGLANKSLTLGADPSSRPVMEIKAPLRRISFKYQLGRLRGHEQRSSRMYSMDSFKSYGLKQIRRGPLSMIHMSNKESLP
jgi:hypothetical protein